MTTYNIYMSGSLVQSVANFVNILGVAADPTTITFKYRTGSGSTTTVVYPSAPIVRVGTGSYTANLDTTGWLGPGNLLYTVEWIGTGAVQAIAPDYWQVEPATL
jgi:hypothetical protein